MLLKTLDRALCGYYNCRSVARWVSARIVCPFVRKLGPIARSRLRPALLAMLTLAMPSAWSAEASPDQWERRTFQNPREAGAILNSYEYGLQYWDAGDHTVPR